MSKINQEQVQLKELFKDFTNRAADIKERDKTRRSLFCFLEASIQHEINLHREGKDNYSDIAKLLRYFIARLTFFEAHHKRHKFDTF